jgi:hypothetical protein
MKILWEFTDCLTGVHVHCFSLLELEDNDYMSLKHNLIFLRHATLSSYFNAITFHDTNLKYDESTRVLMADGLSATGCNSIGDSAISKNYRQKLQVAVTKIIVNSYSHYQTDGYNGKIHAAKPR